MKKTLIFTALLLSGLAYATNISEKHQLQKLCNDTEASDSERRKACFRLSVIEKFKEVSQELLGVLHERLLDECTVRDEMACIIWMDQMARKIKQAEPLASTEKSIISNICTLDVSPEPHTIADETLSELCSLAKSL